MCLIGSKIHVKVKKILRICRKKFCEYPSKNLDFQIFWNWKLFLNHDVSLFLPKFCYFFKQNKNYMTKILKLPHINSNTVTIQHSFYWLLRTSIKLFQKSNSISIAQYHDIVFVHNLWVCKIAINTKGIKEPSKCFNSFGKCANCKPFKEVHK